MAGGEFDASITTLMRVEGTVNGAAFETFLERMLALTLFPGALVLMDSIKTHKSKKVEEIDSWLYL